MIEKRKDKHISEQLVKSHHVFEKEMTAEFFAKFPHIANRIKKIWGSDVCRNYLNTLVTDTRDNTRVGFTQEQISIIIQLIDKHDLEFPQYVNNKKI